jgi:hypothetical protein
MADEKDINFGGLAVALNSRLNAESRITNSAGFFWLCAGAAISIVLIGLGVAAALYGYSSLLSAKPAADEIATALTQAFQHADLKATVSGKMSLVPTELKLAKGQTVRLEDGATVGVDPNSSVRVIGDFKVDMPQPSKEQLQLNATTKSDELPFTSYTIFKDAAYGSGTVETGWDFDLSDTTKPTVQFCRYSRDVTKGLSTSYMLAVDDSPRPPGPLQKLPFNFSEALSNCIWFSGF